MTYIHLDRSLGSMFLKLAFEMFCELIIVRALVKGFSFLYGEFYMKKL